MQTIPVPVQLLSRVRLFVTPWIAARQASLSITSSRSSLRLTSIESVMPSSHLILCCPLLLLPPLADNRIKDLCDTWRGKNLLNRTLKAQRSIKMDYE